MRRLPVWLLVLALAGFGTGLWRLWSLHFETGDSYPAYSSLRADPLGTRALYDGLAGVGVPVQRLYDSLDRLPDIEHTSVLLLGADVRSLEWASAESLQDMESFLNAGGRIVVAFSPLDPEGTERWFRDVHDARDARDDKGAEEVGPEDPEVGKADARDGDAERGLKVSEDPFADQGGTLEDRWQLRFAYEWIGGRGDGARTPPPVTAARVAHPTELPAGVPWRSGLHFLPEGENWEVLYELPGTRAVAMVRRFGRGTLLLTSDSYPFSNEALRWDRHLSLLTWMIAPRGPVAFQESHLGLQETPGVGTLIRHYRLRGMLAGLVILAGLFVWRSSQPLVPPSAMASRRPDIGARDAASGLANLLRRHIPTREILGACVQEWRRSLPRKSRQASKLQQVTALIDAEGRRPARQRNPVDRYLEIVRILRTRRPR